MNELWIVFKSQIDHDDYLVGSRYDKVGPFNTAREAQAFIDECHPMIPGVYKREGIRRGHTITMENVLSWVDTPERYKEKHG